MTVPGPSHVGADATPNSAGAQRVLRSLAISAGLWVAATVVCVGLVLLFGVDPESTNADNDSATYGVILSSSLALVCAPLYCTWFAYYRKQRPSIYDESNRGKLIVYVVAFAVTGLIAVMFIVAAAFSGGASNATVSIFWFFATALTFFMVRRELSRTATMSPQRSTKIHPLRFYQYLGKHRSTTHSDHPQQRHRLHPSRPRQHQPLQSL